MFGFLSGNFYTSWLNLASWYLPDSQLNWESKVEQSGAKMVKILKWIRCVPPPKKDFNLCPKKSEFCLQRGLPRDSGSRNILGWFDIVLNFCKKKKGWNSKKLRIFVMFVQNLYMYLCITPPVQWKFTSLENTGLQAGICRLHFWGLLHFWGHLLFWGPLHFWGHHNFFISC